VLLIERVWRKASPVLPRECGVYVALYVGV